MADPESFPHTQPHILPPADEAAHVRPSKLWSTKMLQAHEKQDERYLGDGVYASHDGYNIWVRAERNGFEHAVAFEPGLIRLLVRYEQDILRKYSSSHGESGEDVTP